MRKWIAVLIAALMLSSAFALAEDIGDYDFEFNDDGYEGEWVTLEGQGMEFCLPEGWKEVESADGAFYAASNGDASASLSIRLEAEGVEDIIAWGETNLDSYEVDEANFYDALVVEADTSITVRFILDEGKLLSFDFVRADAGALSREFALQIVGSTCLTWDDEDFPFPEEDIEGFSFDDDVFDGDDPFSESDDEEDFGEAFEADLG